MVRRVFAVVVVVVAVCGCGKPPEGAVSVPAGGDETRPEQKRAVAMKEASTVGPISAEVVSVKVGKPRRVNGVGSDQECLVVQVRFSTTDTAVAKHYVEPTLWILGVRVRDEFGNEYPQTSGPPDIDGRTENDRIRVGESVTDVWLFEKPLPTAKTITLDFDAACVELDKGEFRFTIPLPGR